MKQKQLQVLTYSLLVLVFPAISSHTNAQNEIIRGAMPPMPGVTFHPQPEGIQVQEFATDLEVVWSLEFASDGRLFVTERPGRVRTISADGVMNPEPWLAMEDRVFHQGESGMTGLALHPEFPQVPWVYIMYTALQEDGHENRLSLFTEVDGRGVDEQILIRGLAVQQRGGSHSGGTLRFGADGMLYVATGDAFERHRSADLTDLAGSVLRLTPEGTVPADNPIADNPIWAYGLRNVHGLDWQPSTGRLFAGDNGPTGEDQLMAHDRVIVLEAGSHHGWPSVVGAAGLPEYVDPILTFVPSSPPGDLLFYTADLMPQFKNDMFVSILGFQPLDRQTLLRVRFQDPINPTLPTAMERWFNDAEGNSVYGRLRALTVGPDGALYVGTSNRDGRQFSPMREMPDKILRITPQ